MNMKRMMRVVVLALVCVATVVVLIDATDVFAQGGSAVGSTFTVHYMDGKTLKFRVESAGRGKGVAALISNAHSSVSWVVEIDNKTVVIPMANVRYVEIEPALNTAGVSVVKATSVK